MPLLGKKIFDHETDRQKDEGSEDYIIPFTKEKFSNKEDFTKRLALYDKPIWFCQCTGHGNMSYYDAFKSEQAAREKVAKLYPLPYEEPVLLLVHHSYQSLEVIIANTQALFQTQYCKGEKVLFTVKPGKTFDATVMKVTVNKTAKDEDSSEKKTDLNGADCSSKISGENLVKENSSISPSSDKENKSKLKSECSEKSGENSSSSQPTPKKKLIMLDYKYDLHLTAKNKIVSDVPVDRMSRVSKLPNRELIRLFIRSNAIRPHSQKEKFPWIVDEDMVFRYTIKPKISRDREREIIRLGTINADNQTPPPPHNPLIKSQDTKEQGFVKQIGFFKREHQLNGDTHRISNSTCCNGSSEHPASGSRPNPDMSLKMTIKAPERKIAPIFSMVKSPNKTSLKSPGKGRGRPRKIKDEDAASPNMKRKSSDPKAVPKKRKKKIKSTSLNLSVNKDVQLVLNSLTDADVVAGESKSSVEGSAKIRKPSNILMKRKQASILDMARKSTTKLGLARSSTFPHLARTVAKKAKQPIVVQHLMMLKREKNFRAHKYKLTLNSAVRMLSEKQRENLPIEVKSDVINKWEVEEYKRRYKSMTRDEKKTFRREQRQQMAENNFMLGINGAKKQGPIEDQFLVRDNKSKDLPLLTPVQLPPGLNNDMFGKVAMLCEFIYSYHTLLCPSEPNYYRQITIFTLSQAVSSGNLGFSFTSKLLVTFLQTLLVDDLAKDYTELDFKLSQLVVSPEIACEMTRICLRRHDDVEDVSEQSSRDCEASFSNEVAQGLVTKEIYMMSPVDQIDVLSALAYRVANTYAVQSHMEEARQRAAVAWSEMCERKKAVKLESKNSSTGPKKKGRKPKPKPEKVKEEPEIDLVSRSALLESQTSVRASPRVKKRQLMSELRRAQEAEQKKKRMEEVEEERKKAETEKVDRLLMETRNEAKNAQRRIPLGTDRNHSRYWLLCDGVPGLYVEHGWVGDYINYSTSTSDPASEPSPHTSRAMLREATWPINGPNLWYTVSNQETFERLVQSLNNRGTRESKLLTAIKANEESILKSIKRLSHLSDQKSSLSLEDGEMFQRQKLRKTLASFICNGHKGNLIEVEDTETVVSRINSCETVEQFSELILEIMDWIPHKNLRHYMTGVSNRRKAGSNSEVEVSEKEKMKAEQRVERFRESLKEAKLFSRCALLLCILNESVRWEQYHCRRSNRRQIASSNGKKKSRRRSVSDAEEESDAENDEEDEEEEDEDDKNRRSSRIRSFKQRKISEEEEKEELETSGRPIRKTRHKTQSYRAMIANGEEEDYEENVESSEVEVSEDEEEATPSGEDEEEEADACIKIIQKLISFAYSEVFRDPVDRDLYSDYYVIIKSPICLNDILTKAEREDTRGDRPYTFRQLVQDIRLMVNNAVEYNGVGHFVTRDALRLARAFKRQSCTMLQLNRESKEFLFNLFPEVTN